MKKSYKNIKIFIFGYFGWYNVGDDSIGLVIIKELFKRHPNLKLKATIKDSYFVSKNGLKNVDIVNFNIISILKAINSSDEFIIAGGTHFQDEDQFLFRRLKINLFFLFISLYARLVGKSPILMGHGIGPISKTLTRRMIKIIFKNSKTIIVRDSESSRVVGKLGYSNKCNVTFDLGVGLSDTFFKSFSEEKGFITLGISMLPVYEIYSGDQKKDESLVREISQAIIELLKNNEKLEVKLFAFRSGAKHSDEKLLNKLSNFTNDYSTRVNCVKYKGNIPNFLTEMFKCDFFIGMRYHSLLFCYIQKKPFIAINYMKKCRYLTEEIQLPERAILNLNEVTNSIISKKINEMILDPDKYRAKYPVKNVLQLKKKSFDILDREILD